MCLCEMEEGLCGSEIGAAVGAGSGDKVRADRAKEIKMEGLITEG